MFIINSYTYKSFSGLDLNNYASDSPVLALSLRRINSTYTGPLVRLRRSSDNSESDFGSGLSMGDFIDYSAVDTWAGGSTVSVTTWYDQSGEARHLTQTVSSRQPQLSSGATTGRAVKFSGAGDNNLQLNLNGTDFFSTGPAFSIHHATDNTDTGFCSNMTISSAPTAAGQTSYFRTNRYSNVARISWRGTQYAASVATVSGNEYNYYHHDGSTISIDIDSTEVLSNANTSTTRSGGDTFNLGADADRHEWDGYTYELVVFDSSQATSDSDDIRDDMTNTYNI